MELFKLLGTIAVDTAEAIKALKDAQQEGEKTESKLGKAFSAIGKGAVAIGKTALVGLGAAATGITALGTAAIKAYGDYEQLLGGVETLFGTRGAKTVQEYADMVGKSVKDVEAEFGMLQQAQSDVMKNAAKAYETAGLSMNDYMETANGLAAALNQSSASQLESAALADQAIIDMADNSAKMGTSMEAIQTAYAGFAKQNYTMLDNLKLGYGGTKEEMQRLLDDAGKISGIKYDLSSFADITEAIHVMQEEMGIAGTTAAEASGTIQGSLGMLKGAWSNLMVGLSDPEADLSSLINNVFTSVDTFARNLIPRITQVLSGIATSFKTLVPMITAEIPGLLEQILPSLIEGAASLVNGVVTAFPSIISALLDVLPMLIEGVMSIVDSLIGALPQIMQAIVTALPTLIPQLIDAVVGLILMLVEMLPQIIQPIIDALPTIILAITDALLSNLPALIQGAIQLIGALCAAFPQILVALWEAIKGIFVMLGEKILGFFEPVKTAISNAWQAMGNVPGLSSMKTMIENVWGAIKNFITTYINAIKNIVTTVWNSIKNVISTVINSIKNVISTAWNAIKTIISNVMKLISSVLKGDWEGVKSAISNILNAIKSVIKSIWDGIKNTISSVLNGIKNVVSSVWNGIKSVISSYLNMIKTTISSIWNGIKGAISGAVSGIKTTVTTGFKDVKNKVVNAFKDLPSKLKTIGKNLVQGLWNGINNAKDWVLGKIKGFGKGILNGLKSFFGIKSPSRVMRDQVGKMIAEGTAVGIEEGSKKVESASEKMGNAILKTAEKVLDEYKTYNNLTLTEEMNFWDEIRVQCEEGTDARLSADKKYLEAKKSLDDQLKTAEETLQKSLEETSKKVEERAKAIANTFDLFSSFKVDDYVDSYTMIRGLDSQISALEEYQTRMDELRSKIGDTALFKELESMGISALNKVEALTSMTDMQLQIYTNMFDERNALAHSIAKEELADETFAATQEAYQTFAKTCGELGVSVETATAGMQTSTATAFTAIAETVSTSTQSIADTIGDKMQNAVDSVNGAIAKIKKAFESFTAHMKMPHISVSGTFSVNPPSAPQFAVEWYKKAMNTPMLMNEPTIFGYNAASGNFMGGGEAGSEVVSGTNTLMNMIQNAVASQNDALVHYMQKIVEILAKYFPQLLEAFDVDVYLDSGVLVGEMAVPMNQALGILSSRKDRGR